MPLTIATGSDPFFTQTTTLDGVSFTLRFTYNQRENAYYLSLQDPVSGSDIISGVKLVCNYNLLQRYGGLAGMPAGEFVALSKTSDTSPAGLGDLGDNGRVSLIYFTAADLGVIP